MIFDLIMVVLITTTLVARFEQLRRARPTFTVQLVQMKGQHVQLVGVTFRDMVPAIQRATAAVARFGVTVEQVTRNLKAYNEHHAQSPQARWRYRA